MTIRYAALTLALVLVFGATFGVVESLAARVVLCVAMCGLAVALGLEFSRKDDRW